MKSSTTGQTPNPQQRGLFVGLAFFAGAIVAYMFCVQPAQESLARAKQEVDTLTVQQTGTTADLTGAKKLKERLLRLEAERKPYLDGLLTPLLESYAMRAKSILDPIAAESGLTVAEYAELPKRLLPLVQPKPAPQLYARQPVRLTCRGSYAAIVSFVMRVEKLLPLVAVQAFSLKAQQDNDVQTATLVLEWPVLGRNTAGQPQNGGGKK